MSKMSIIQALKDLHEVNNFDEILVKTNASEPQTIESAIEDVMRNAEDPNEEIEVYVSTETIREVKNGYINPCEPLYRVVRTPY